MKNLAGKTVFYSLIIILAAQFNMNLFINDFKISIACICFPAFLFLAETFPIVSVTFCSAFGVFGSRVLFLWFRTGTLDQSVSTYLPEMLFYLVYGFLLCLYVKLLKGRQPDKNYRLIPLIITDYAANLIELVLRLNMDAFTFKTQTSIILIAAVRTAATWCILSAFEKYRLLLLKQEHEARYKRLVFLISKLNEEVVWMQKNTALIENTMNTSYKLYEKLKVTDPDSELSKSSLSVAKDIHEIKKEYLLIMRGISETLDEEFKSDGMFLTELLELLKDSTALLAKECRKSLTMTTSCPYNTYTDKHYILMSVFRNLLVNAIEASTSDVIHIQLIQKAAAGCYIFSVTDDGPGILPENQTDIFHIGFSTKINYTTGEVNRGLGLNLVKDLVENQLDGILTLASAPGNTTFTISIPTESLEVK